MGTAPATDAITAAPSEAALANIFPNELADETTGFDSLGPFTEEPSPEQDANPVPAKKGWDNETGSQAFNTWGQSFCTAHRVGSFCDQYTQVRCCRTSWGFAKCGTTVHSSRCGWHAGWGAGGWHAGGWHAGGWHFNEVTEQSQENASVEVLSPELADVFPDETTGFDGVGPFEEEPSSEQDANPVPAKTGWDNETGLQAAAFNTWGRSFCESHHVGTFCDQTTQIRCCRTSWGFEKCGTTVHSSRCGWRGGASGGWSGGSSAWHIHPGWRQSSFCRSHHVGFFCFNHRKVHCCNDHGHFVECTTRSESSWRC